MTKIHEMQRATAAILEDPLPDLPQFSEENLALRFTEKHAADLRYVDAWSKWMRWDGHVWRADNTLAVFDEARAVCRAAAGEVEGERQSTAVRVASAKTVSAVEHLARCDRRHAATGDQWDADQWLLNTPCGAVDLSTGTLRPSRREDYCTKSTAVAPAGDCPLWLKFLDRVTGGDGSLQAFLQRTAGYVLTGSTRTASRP